MPRSQRPGRARAHPRGTCSTKPPSAELRPDQRDDQSLPPYEELDPIIEAYVEQDRTAGELIEAGFDPALVQRIVRLIDLAEYKRRQTPPGVRITTKAFGKDRRLPITNRYRGLTRPPTRSFDGRPIRRMRDDRRRRSRRVTGAGGSGRAARRWSSRSVRRYGIPPRAVLDEQAWRSSPLGAAVVGAASVTADHSAGGPAVEPRDVIDRAAAGTPSR